MTHGHYNLVLTQSTWKVIRHLVVKTSTRSVFTCKGQRRKKSSDMGGVSQIQNELVVYGFLREFFKVKRAGGEEISP